MRGRIIYKVNVSIIALFFRFISLPIVVMIATQLPKFRREKIVNAVDLTVALRAHFFFMVIEKSSESF